MPIRMPSQSISHHFKSSTSLTRRPMHMATTHIVRNGSGMCSNICRNSSAERAFGSRFRFMYPKAVHQKLIPNDGARVRRFSDSRAIPKAAETLRAEKPYVHILQYCEHRCYAQNGRMSVWP